MFTCVCNDAELLNFGNTHVNVPVGNLNRQLTDFQGQYKLILYHTTLIGDLLHGIHELPVILLVCILGEAWMRLVGSSLLVLLHPTETRGTWGWRLTTREFPCQ